MSNDLSNDIIIENKADKKSTLNELIENILSSKLSQERIEILKQKGINLRDEEYTLLQI